MNNNKATESNMISAPHHSDRFNTDSGLKGLLVIVSQGQSRSPDKRSLEEAIATIAASLPQTCSMLVPNLYDLANDSQSVSKMRSGQALEDTDRWPWLERIGRYLAQAPDNSVGRVVACSALKRAYRDQIRRMAPRARFVFLDGTPELIGQRLALRTGHYMPPDLLHSQFQTLERPDASESDVSTLSVAGTADQVLAAAVQRVRGFMSSEGQALELH